MKKTNCLLLIQDGPAVPELLLGLLRIDDVEEKVKHLDNTYNQI
jgi:hypothetical protein